MVLLSCGRGVVEEIVLDKSDLSKNGLANLASSLFGCFVKGHGSIPLILAAGLTRCCNLLMALFLTISMHLADAGCFVSFCFTTNLSICMHVQSKSARACSCHSRTQVCSRLAEILRILQVSSWLRPCNVVGGFLRPS